MRRPMPSLWWEGRTASKLRWACSSPKYMMAKATTRSRSQESSVNVSLFALEREIDKQMAAVEVVGEQKDDDPDHGIYPRAHLDIVEQQHSEKNRHYRH